jgi:hypothetical protein
MIQAQYSSTLSKERYTMLKQSTVFQHQESHSIDKTIDAEIHHTTLIKTPIEKDFDTLTPSLSLTKGSQQGQFFVEHGVSTKR